MAVTYFQGFDIHQKITANTGLNAGGDDDLAHQFFGGTPVRLGYVPGYQSGRAVFQDRSFMIQGRTSGDWATVGGVGGAHCGFWTKIEPADIAGFSNLIKIWVAGVYIWVRVFGDRRVQIFQGASALDPGVPISNTASTLLGANWQHMEFRVNFLNGTAGLYQNGSQLLSGSFSPVSPTQRARIYLGGSGTNSLNHLWNITYDHLYITDNNGLSGNPVEAVSIDTSQDRFESINGFRGTLIIDGNRYVTPWNNATISSQNTYGGVFGVNVCNTVTYFFLTNPSTGQLWTPAAYNNIESWGVCFQEFNSTTLGGRARLDALILSRLEYNGGLPIVTYKTPGVTTQYSGPWERSNPDKTLASHVNVIPRPNVDLQENAESLYIGYPGCLLFTGQDPEEDTPIFPEIGLTFAEKTQANHRDWTSVDGEGESAEAYFISGYGVYGESNKKFQSNYVTVNYETAPTGQAYIQGVWDYSVDPDTGRWSMKQQVYGPKTVSEYKHGSRKLKIRGHGKALQLKVSSFGDSPFIINGWALLVTSNTAV